MPTHVAIAIVLVLVLIAICIFVLYAFSYRSIRVKFGHAFPHPSASLADPVGDVINILRGTGTLGPRDPTAVVAVSDAEHLLGITASRRPIYTFIGNLHPALGRVGLIIKRAWFDNSAQGVSRCDTGGLASCCAGFACLTHSEAESAIGNLSHQPNDEWERAFRSEISLAYGFPWKSWRRYLEGKRPLTVAIRDVRGRCIQFAARHDKLDRRLWTWEARGYANVAVEHLYAIVFSHEASKEFYARAGGAPLPANVEILCGSVSASGVRHFQEEQVIQAFMA